MNSIIRKSNSFVSHLALGISLLAYGYFIVLLATSNLNLQYLWFDEANQFWVSRGQLISNSPGSLDGSILETYSLNNTMNLDPGGYSYYLRAFTEILGTEINSLRLSSFLFFLGFVGVTIFMSLKVSRNNTVRVIFLFLVSFVIFSPDVRWYAFEVRAYEYSAFAVLVLILVTRRMFHVDSIFLKYCWLLAFTLAIGSRYTAMPYALACYLFLLYLALRSAKGAKHYGHNLIVFLIATFEIATLYFFVVVKQNNGSGPTYVNENMLTPSNIKNWNRILEHNFLGFPGIFRLIILMLLVALVVERIFKYRVVGNSETKSIILLNVITALQICLSFFGLLPWESQTRWAIEDYSFTVVSIFLIFKIVKSMNKVDIQPRLKSTSLTGLAVFILLIGISNRQHFIQNFQRTANVNIFTQELVPKLISGQNNLLVGSSVYPEIRYLAERNGQTKKVTDLWLDASIQQFDSYNLDSFKAALLQNRSTNSEGLIVISKYWDKDFESEVLFVLRNVPNSEILEIQERNTIGWIFVTWSKN